MLSVKVVAPGAVNIAFSVLASTEATSRANREDKTTGSFIVVMVGRREGGCAVRNGFTARPVQACHVRSGSEDHGTQVSSKVYRASRLAHCTVGGGICIAAVAFTTLCHARLPAASTSTCTAAFARHAIGRTRWSALALTAQWQERGPVIPGN